MKKIFENSVESNFLKKSLGESGESGESGEAFRGSPFEKNIPPFSLNFGKVRFKMFRSSVLKASKSLKIRIFEFDPSLNF